MARAHLEWIATEVVPEEAVSGGPLSRARRRLLSSDDVTNAWTALVTFGPGWTGKLDTGGLTELFVVEGELRVEGVRLGPLGYARLGPMPREPVVVSRPTRALVLADPSGAAPAAAVTIDASAAAWEPPSRGGLPGLALKTLWAGEDGAACAFLAGCVPGFESPAEYHTCPEEILILAGGVDDGRVAAGPGDYLWRPAWVTHGPYRSPAGLLALVRGHGPIVAHWIDDPAATPEANRARHEGLGSG